MELVCSLQLARVLDTELISKQTFDCSWGLAAHNQKAFGYICQ